MISGNVMLEVFMFVSVTVARSKASLGWTPLHLACYFGHMDAVEKLLKVRVGLYYSMSSSYVQQWNVIYGTYLQAGADANLQNNMGDTPLHKAAYTGRKVKKKTSLPQYLSIYYNNRCCIVTFDNPFFRQTITFTDITRYFLTEACDEKWW